MPRESTAPDRFPVPDEHRFIAAVAGESQSGFFDLRAELDGELIGRDWARLSDPGAVDRAVRWINEWRGRANVLIGSAPRSRKRGRDSDSPLGWIVSVDFDTDAGLAVYAASGLRATWEIASGGRTDSGRQTMHAHWVLTHPLSMRELRQLREQLAEALLGDESFHGNAIRVPGTLNFKYDPPREVEQLHHGEWVSATSIRDTLPTPNPFVEVAKRAESKRRASLTTVAEIVADAIENDDAEAGSRDPAPFRFALRLRNALIPETVTRNALDTFSGQRAPKRRCSDAQLDGITRALYRDDEYRGFRDELRVRIEDVTVSDLPDAPKAALLAMHLLAHQGLAEGRASFTVTASHRLISDMTNVSDAAVERAIGELRQDLIEPIGLDPELNGASRYRLLRPPNVAQTRARGCGDGGGPEGSDEASGHTFYYYSSLSLIALARATLEHDAFTRSGLGKPSLFAFLRLASLGSPIPLSDFAAILGVSKPTASKTLRTLERYGLATRSRAGRRDLWQADPLDVRAKLGFAAADLGVEGTRRARHERHGAERTRWDSKRETLKGEPAKGKRMEVTQEGLRRKNGGDLAHVSNRKRRASRQAASAHASPPAAS